MASAVPPEPTLTVSAVARRMGVAPPTLRTWDRRYGLGPSGHTAGAHRRYTSGDVARLLVMRRLTLEGVSPADAAKIAKATLVQGDEPVTPASGGLMAGPETGSGNEDRASSNTTSLVPVARGPSGSDLGRPPGLAAGTGDAAAAETGPAGAGETDDHGPAGSPADDYSQLFSLMNSAGPIRGPAGGGRVVALPYGTPQSRGLARAAMALDAYEVTRMVRDAVHREGAVSAWTSMIMPVLQALGDRWRATGELIEVEHVFCEAVLGALRTVLLDSPYQGRNTITVLLACAEGDYHSLPLHALAAALAERKVSCKMLGTGLPSESIAISVRRTGPAVIVLFARLRGADASQTQILRRQRPAPTVVLAGPGWRPDTVPSFARSAGSLQEAIDEVLLGAHV